MFFILPVFLSLIFFLSMSFVSSDHDSVDKIDTGRSVVAQEVHWSILCLFVLNIKCCSVYSSSCTESVTSNKYVLIFIRTSQQCHNTNSKDEKKKRRQNKSVPVEIYIFFIYKYINTFRQKTFCGFVCLFVCVCVCETFFF